MTLIVGNLDNFLPLGSKIKYLSLATEKTTFLSYTMYADRICKNPLEYSGLQIRVRNQKLIFLFFNQNMWVLLFYGSFEHPKQMLKLIDKKIFKVLC